MSAHRKYLWAATLVAFTTTMTVVAANVLVDPYGLFEVIRLPGLNDVKPAAADSVRTAKPYQMIRARPKTLIVGNSRPEAGIDPASDCWGEEDRPVFNAAIPGIGVYHQARLAQAAILEGHVERIYWGIDFVDFVGLRQPPPSAWPWGDQGVSLRLPTNAKGEPNPRYLSQYLSDSRDATLSLSAAIDSATTMVNQRNQWSSTRRADGFNPGWDYRGIIHTEGQGVLFEQKNREVVRRLAANGLALFAPGHEWSREFESLRFILALAESKGVQTVLFINPYHADYLSAIELTGRWSLFEQWKRHLAELTARFESATLWDFSAFDRYSTTAPDPGTSIGQSLEWYWEPAHYRAELGELMISRMRGVHCADGGGALGISISASNIDSHLAGLKQGKELYARSADSRWRMVADIVSKKMGRLSVRGIGEGAIPGG